MSMNIKNMLAQELSILKKAVPMASHGMAMIVHTLFVFLWDHAWVVALDPNEVLIQRTWQ